MTALVPAATVALLRDAPPGLEVFLVRRHDNIAFMGGAHVFPGGRLDDADRVMAAGIADTRAVAIAARLADLSAVDALAHGVAALRELFEEAGVLLARDASGRIADIHGVHEERFAGYRMELAAGRTTFAGMLAAERLAPAIDALAYFAHWVTPSIETRRFDTRFFAAIVPDSQQPRHDDAETTHGAWVRPHDAIARAYTGDIALPPPTWTTLRWLERFATATAVIEWAHTTPTPRIEPGFIQQPGVRIVTLPGDPTFPPVAGFTAAETRFLLDGGRWRPIVAD